METINKEMTFNVGDAVIIKSEPRFWNSFHCNNSPLEANLKYPYQCVIKKIGISESGLISMTCGKYGWSMSELLKGNLIEKIHLKIHEDDL